MDLNYSGVPGLCKLCRLQSWAVSGGTSKLQICRNVIDYPTLLDLCGLPAYEKNVGISLVSEMKENISSEHGAITTYGINKHSDYNFQSYFVEQKERTETEYIDKL